MHWYSYHTQRDVPPSSFGADNDHTLHLLHKVGVPADRHFIGKVVILHVTGGDRPYLRASLLAKPKRLNGFL